MSSPGRIPSLDGLRAISIALVIFNHLIGTHGFPLGRDVHHQLGDLGSLGVRVFFVISGYLITTLLLREHDTTGGIALGRFYLRRAWRIFPAFYTFVAAMTAAWAIGWVALSAADLIASVTYTVNYRYARAWTLGHIWSLSVEEQFYLLWPALIVIAGRKRVALLAIGLIAAAPVFRVLAWFAALPHRDEVIEEAYPCVMDAIAAGSLMAALRTRLDRHHGYLRALGSRWFALVPLAVVVINRPSWFGFEYTAGMTLVNLGIALVVDRCVRFPDGFTGRLLDRAPLVWIGTLSYSLYLWQQPFLDRTRGGWAFRFPLSLALALACAIASHYLIERRFLAWRDRRARAARLTAR